MGGATEEEITVISRSKDREYFITEYQLILYVFTLVLILLLFNYSCCYEILPLETHHPHPYPPTPYNLIAIQLINATLEI